MCVSQSTAAEDSGHLGCDTGLFGEWLLMTQCHISEDLNPQEF